MATTVLRPAIFGLGERKERKKRNEREKGKCPACILTMINSTGGRKKKKDNNNTTPDTHTHTI